jgi:hypothetical protein
MKYLWATALVVLLASLSAGGAFAADGVTVTAQDLPSDMVWDATYDASVDAENSGDASPADDWDTNYVLAAVSGVTPTATAGPDRWGLTFTPASGVTPTVAVGGSNLFQFTVEAPPWTTLQYTAVVGLTDPGSVDDLECDWMMTSDKTNIGPNLIQSTYGIAESDVVIGRFLDVGGSQWARFWIEELAGLVPVIAKGYPDGLQRPSRVVDRAAMAVYITRAMKEAEVTPGSPTFTDVPDTHWAYGFIEAAVANDVIQGYGSYYDPSGPVNRAAMCVFVARAKGWVDIADDLDTAGELFPDVAAGFWAGVAIEECMDHYIVKGYPDGYFRPGVALSRDQMAVFMWRAFIASTGAAVVLGGPDTTDATGAGLAAGVNNPGTLNHYGWSDVGTDPTWAYVAFDALRIDTDLAAGGTWDVTFDFRDAATPTVAGTTLTLTMNPAAIGAAWTAGRNSGDPYLVLAVAVPALGTGDYVLVVHVEDKDGTVYALDRTVSFSLS